MRTVLGQVRFDVLVYLDDIVDPVAAARDPGLVGDDGDGDAGPVERGDGLRRPVDELNAVDRAHVPVVDDYRAVAIKQDARPHWILCHVTSPEFADPGASPLFTRSPNRRL